MKIGELAKRAGVNIQTVRFYEREHLLPEPVRTSSGYRLYSDKELDTVIFIKRCQHLGFTLKEIKQLIDLHNAFVNLPHWSTKVMSDEAQKFLSISEERLHSIDEKIGLLQEMKTQLSSLVLNFQSSTVLICPASQPKRSARSTKRRSAKTS